MRSRAELPRPRPAGFSLVEATIAVLLLLAALTTALQALSWIARDRAALDRRAAALREADNLLERLASGDLMTDGGSAPSPVAARLLPDAAIEVERAIEPADGLAMERITVIVRYSNRRGVPAAPVRLSTWVSTDHDVAGKEDTP